MTGHRPATADRSDRRRRRAGAAPLLAAAGLVLVAAVLGSCGGGSTTASPAGTASTGGTAPATAEPVAVVPAPVQALTIEGTEYAFTIEPDAGRDLHAGWTAVTFHNTGAEAHQVMFARLKDGVDLAELAGAAGGDSSGSAAIGYVDMLGGVSYIGPGRTTEAMVELPEGVVMAMCYVPDSHGVAHALSGMTTMLTVGPAPDTDSPPSAGPSSTPGTAAAVGQPVAGTIAMGADGYELPSPMPAGWYRVVNRDVDEEGTGLGLHELSILGLERELDQRGIDRLLGNLATNAPPGVSLEALGGMGALSAGSEAYLFLDLAPGPYLAVDFMPDPGDPRPHLLDGYATPFRP